MDVAHGANGMPPSPPVPSPRPLAEAQAATPVAVGQRIQATVAAVLDGVVWLGYRGGLFAATAAQPLEAGRSYDFVVTRTEPQVELKLAEQHGARPSGPPLPMGGALLASLLRHLGAGPGQQPRGHRSPALLSEDGAKALVDWSRGQPTGKALSALGAALGLDLEGRVALLHGLPAKEQGAAAQILRDTAKARALLLLAEPGTPAPERAALQAFVAAAAEAQRDQAARNDLMLPQWLPLPNCPAMGLLDARLFCQGRDARPESAGDDQPDAVVVLLLDFTELGDVRVDLAVHGHEIDVQILAAKPAAQRRLHLVREELAAELSLGGLRARSIRVLAAPAALPVADLLSPPRDGTALVDCHA